MKNSLPNTLPNSPRENFFSGLSLGLSPNISTGTGINNYYPGFQEFCQLAQPGLMVPVWREVVVDTETPVTAFHKTAGKKGSFLLESVEGGERPGRYSFQGSQPFLTFSAKGRQIRLEFKDGTVQEYEGNVVEEVRRILAEHPSAVPANSPRFCGGAVGCFGYEFGQQLEKLPSFHNPSTYPDVYLMFVDSLYAFDHRRHTMIFLVNARIENDPQSAYATVCQQIDQMIQDLRDSNCAKQTLEEKPQKSEKSAPLMTQSSEEHCAKYSNKPTANFTKPEFCQAVSRAQEHIYAGDVFQVVLSQKFRVPCATAPFNLYRALRSVNPSPYLFYLDCGGFQIVGSSPEVHVRLEKDRAILRPIAGTRPRGKDINQDAQLAQELLSDPKERAEHVMLVDLARNDLGRVCRYGTVQVEELMQVEQYSHVMHLVSQVSGQLQDGEDGLSLLAATFPAGTVSGAPKIRAMELIAELESEARGVYAGAVGYLSFQGNLDTGIVIRTMVVDHGEVNFQAGAGIVADSKPELEYQETLNKAQAMLKAIRQTEEGVLWF